MNVMMKHHWVLEGYFAPDGRREKRSLKEFPYLLGRSRDLEQPLPCPSISRKHAMIEANSEGLQIKDLHSSNGTYVNREPVRHVTELHHGDIIHLGDVELRLLDEQHEQSEEVSDETQFIATGQLDFSRTVGVFELEQLLDMRLIQAVFQPVIARRGLRCIGYEALARGAHPQLPDSPLPLFEVAERHSLEVSLSELMREIGLIHACEYKLDGRILLNTHQNELANIDRLMRHMHSLRKQFPEQVIMLEIHEHAVTDDIHVLQSLKQALKEINIDLAFDDFGVGQSRLMELVSAAPAMIKFDRALIADIDKADEAKLNLLRHLKELCDETGIETLAECVSNEDEYRTCESLGFDYYQGYHFARPQAAHEFSTRQ
jgi:EAL domain-containing protein (putative c-di-GMP-specific phosphodiesterase class I)